MGACASSQYTKQGRISLSWASTISIIHLDGRLQEFKNPIKAGHVLTQNPNCFLCCSETMYVGSLLAHVPIKEELQMDQIYFLIPLSIPQIPISIKDLCALAIKANAALAHNAEPRYSILKSSSISCKNGVGDTKREHDVSQKEIS